jgi:hypothetical protein
VKLVAFLGLFFDPEYGGDMFVRNVGWLSMDYMALYPRRQNYSTEVSPPGMFSFSDINEKQYSKLRDGV